MKNIIFSAILLFNNYLFAQSGETYKISENSTKPERIYAPINDLEYRLTKAEKADLLNAERHSSFGALFLADSFSKIGDSIAASKNLLKVSPYLFMFGEQTPATIDTYLTHHFTITKAVLKKYETDFVKNCKQPPTKDWMAFKKMYEDREKIIQQLDQCAENDFVIYPMLRAQLDSLGDIHDAYLRNYVQINGWPTLANGSLYADAIIKYHYGHNNLLYLYLIKNAIYNGDASFEQFKSTRYWYDRENDKDAAIYPLINRKHLCFSMGSMKNYILPESLEVIEHVIQQHCPVIFSIVAESQNLKTGNEWNDKRMSKCLDCRDSLNLLFSKLAEYNCRDTKEFFHGRTFNDMCRTNAGWTMIDGCLPTENKDVRIILYVGWGDEIKDTAAFKMTFKDKKFITHAINFENNKATIQQESIGYMVNMAEWLKDNKNINLEIDGHTDNTGTPASNQKLSEERAQAVKNMLVSMGVSENRLTTKGFGSSVPLEPNTAPEDKANNRRVEFIKL